MVRHIHATLDDDDFKMAEEAKGEMTWSEFIVMAAKEHNRQ